MVCPKCKVEKTDDDFHRDKRRPSGRAYYCKSCVAAYSKSIGPAYRASDAYRTAKRKYLDSQKGKDVTREYSRRSYLEKRDQRLARIAVNYALRSGKLIRPDICSECGVGCKPDAHHEDYLKRLEIVWLCKTCHTAKHPRGQ